MSDSTRVTGTETAVDLAEDLLKTQTLTQDQKSEGASPRSALGVKVSPNDSVDDLLESARILMSEGFLDEAKQVLRRVLLKDARNVTARKRLEEIHEIELKQLFGGSPTTEPPKPTGKAQAQADREQAKAYLEGDADEAMRSLDRDLELGVFRESSILGSKEAELKLADSLEEQLSDLSARQRIDVAVGFMEMELYSIAIRQLRIAELDSEHSVSARFLLIQSLLASEQAFEAALELERILGDSDLPEESRIHFIYWMGRAQEALGRKQLAKLRYIQVCEQSPDYRDAVERMDRLS